MNLLILPSLIKTTVMQLCDDDKKGGMTVAYHTTTKRTKSTMNDTKIKQESQ
jgi:hypothetical protein